MPYNAPDYEIVQLTVDTLFASYTSVCNEKSYWEWIYTVPCENTDNYQYKETTFTGLGFGSSCYTGNQA